MTKYTYRFLARIVVEAVTPLSVSSGAKDVYSDSLVAKDVNGLPYIPGTTIAGVLRHILGDLNKKDSIFGYQINGESKEGKGSHIIFSDAKIRNSRKEVVDGLDIEAKQDSLLCHYENLPIRQHAKITHKGVTEDKGKFDEEVCFAGTQFCFEVEMVSDGQNYEKFEFVLNQIKNRTFRLGSGTHCGFGEVKIVDFQTMKLNLSSKQDLTKYLDKSSSLKAVGFWDSCETCQDSEDSDVYDTFVLSLKPFDFFMFGSGLGDDKADMTPQKGFKVDWSNGIGKLEKNLVLIPATSVKGALAHRVAFHYNKKKGIFANEIKIEDYGNYVGNNNKAVSELFGAEGEKDPYNKNRLINQRPGNLIFSDIIENKKFDDKILNHVAIDRFTGGAIQGALFSEKSTYLLEEDKTFEMQILAKKSVLESDSDIEHALIEALKDICKGMLPLGGGTNRGNGIFTGVISRNGESIKL